MPYDPPRYRRRSIRLQGYDYSQEGVYFVTICTQKGGWLFGTIVDGNMRLNNGGTIAQACWVKVPAHFSHIALDVFVVMPNHVHGILSIADRADRNVGAGSLRPCALDGASSGVQIETKGAETAPLQRKPTLGQTVAYFTYESAKRINAARGTPGAPVWQRNYYEHVVRNAETLTHIREYMLNNPLHWALDQENPTVGAGSPRPYNRPDAKPRRGEPWEV